MEKILLVAYWWQSGKLEKEITGTTIVRQPNYRHGEGGRLELYTYENLSPRGSKGKAVKIERN